LIVWGHKGISFLIFDLGFAIALSRPFD